MNNIKFKISILLFAIIIIIPFISNAQRWKRTRYEVIGGAGPSFFFGDLGGGNKDAVRFMGDLDMQATRYHLLLGVRYKLKEKIALKLNLVYGRINGSDLYTESEGRRPRNVTFNSNLFEPSLQFEYSVLKERLGNKFTFRNMKYFKFSYLNTYLFTGIGGVLSNPKVNFISPTNKNQKFHKFNMSIPIGIGIKYAIDSRISLGLEYGQRYTSTDYLDGHSDKFSKARDSYSFLTLNVTYKLKTSRSGLPVF
jgi:opacity protein-like surface antigen